MSVKPFLEFELTDIFQELKAINGDWNTFKNIRTIAENIIEILKREGFWNNDVMVIFQKGSLQNIQEDFYQYDYVIYDTILREKVASGTCYGSGTTHNVNVNEPTAFQIMDMTLELHDYDKLMQPIKLVFS